MNIMPTPSLCEEKNSEEKIFASAADKVEQVCIAVIDEEDKSSKLSHISLVRAPVGHLRKKLLILDLNGLLADIVQPAPKNYKPDFKFAGRAIFKRPFCQDFLKFCFERFEVGVWSSRIKKNVTRVTDYLLGDMKHKLLLCWDLSYCTPTKFKTLAEKHKFVVFKELRRIWEKHDRSLPWVKGDYNESNTLLLDDSPYKALLNPVLLMGGIKWLDPQGLVYSTVIRSGAGGDLRVYLEGLAMAENVQEYVKQNPFGQRAITQTSENWEFYQRVINSLGSLPTRR
ncbi:putative fcp1 likey domain-containing protein [Fagus crenata]